MGQAFFFSYGSVVRNYGEVVEFGRPLTINFPRENPEGYGYTIRHGIDGNLEGTKVNLEISSDVPFEGRLEYKVLTARGPLVATSTPIKVEAGDNDDMDIDIPSLPAALQELCLFIPRQEIERGKITVKVFEVN